MSKYIFTDSQKLTEDICWS